MFASVLRVPDARVFNDDSIGDDICAVRFLDPLRHERRGLVSLITFQRRMVNRGLYTSTGMLSRDVVDDDAARISGLQIVIVFRLRLTELFAFRRFLEIRFYVTGTVMRCS